MGGRLLVFWGVGLCPYTPLTAGWGGCGERSYWGCRGWGCCEAVTVVEEEA